MKMQRIFFRKAAVVATALAAFCVFADNWVYDPNGHIDYLDAFHPFGDVQHINVHRIEGRDNRKFLLILPSLAAAANHCQT